MGTAAGVIQAFQTDEWNANVYGTLSVVSNFAASMKNRANTIHLAYSLHKINRQLHGYFAKIHDAVEGKIKIEVSSEPITEERTRQMISDLMRMYHSIDRAYDWMSHAGLLNNSLTSSQVRKFKQFREEILDLADWVETSLHAEEIDAKFKRASEERERGDIHTLNQVK